MRRGEPALVVGSHLAIGRAAHGLPSLITMTPAGLCACSGPSTPLTVPFPPLPSTLQFFTIVAMPLYQSFVSVFPACADLLTAVRSNYTM